MYFCFASLHILIEVLSILFWWGSVFYREKNLQTAISQLKYMYIWLYLCLVIFSITRRTCCAQRYGFKIDWLFVDVELRLLLLLCIAYRSLQRSLELSPILRMWSCCMVLGIMIELTCRSFVEPSKNMMVKEPTMTTRNCLLYYVMIVNFGSRLGSLYNIRAAEWQETETETIQ